MVQEFYFTVPVNGSVLVALPWKCSLPSLIFSFEEGGGDWPAGYMKPGWYRYEVRHKFGNANKLKDNKEVINLPKRLCKNDALNLNQKSKVFFVHDNFFYIKMVM